MGVGRLDMEEHQDRMSDPELQHGEREKLKVLTPSISPLLNLMALLLLLPCLAGLRIHIMYFIRRQILLLCPSTIYITYMVTALTGRLLTVF